jgi:glycosyltransferase involved in cell wall biosynthesis
VHVALVMRKAFPGQYSVERVFETICQALPSDIEAEIVRLPHQSSGCIPRLRNICFTRRVRADVVHVTGDVQYCALGVQRSRCVVTVLDLVSLRRLRGLRRHVFFLVWYRLPIWWAAKVTAISEATREELLSHIPTARAKVSSLPCPVAPGFSSAVRRSNSREVPQVLLVGTGPNKNLETVVRALVGLPVHLRIIGRVSEGEQVLLEEGRLSYSADHALSESQLVREYIQSDMLLFVSRYEGFGLPILEAQAVGLPVITSCVASMPEVAGDGAFFVDPLDEGAIRSAVVTLMKSPGLAKELPDKGYANVKAFNSVVIAERYAKVYREVASGQ